jgi:hypothetical protein
MKHIRGIAHITHTPRPIGIINNPKVMGDHGNKN